DNWRRFAALGKAAADVALGQVKGLSFDLLHAHDWQAALAPVYVRYAPGDAPKPSTVVTIHNIAFQGQFAASHFKALGLPAAAWSVDGVEYYGDLGFLKGGLASADAITTVSPTYAQEILRPEYGMGLEGLIAHRRGALHGILNGIDTAQWNPATDAALAMPFSRTALAKRKANKRALEKAFGLARGDGPLFVVISRLSWQKGMDMLIDSIDALVGMGARLALLGSGDAALEGAFRVAEARHKGRVAIQSRYDEPLSHLCQGGGDAIIIPSRFEPCGLTQLYGLAYACVPVVARTGGLHDTVINANAAALEAGVATGVKFDLAGADALIAALHQAVALYADRPTWRMLQRNGMAADFSWSTSGAAYAALYRGLCTRA
ncbi:MAG: glycogen synthase GlgA, partial [Alphaproteobacteria bacterium]|nr:glycogen synthase GlgA [Alphaproteobacteria bacterium]